MALYFSAHLSEMHVSCVGGRRVLDPSHWIPFIYEVPRSGLGAGHVVFTTTHIRVVGGRGGGGW